MNVSETWKPVVGAKGYEVSDLGNVRSLDRIVKYQRNGSIIGRVYAGRLLNPSTRESGHLIVGLGRLNGKRVYKEVHVIVLEAFRGPRPPNLESLHGDGIPSNNKLENLQWGTRSQNSIDALQHGARASGERHFRAKLTDEDVRLIRSDLAGKISYQKIADRFGVKKATIAQIIQNRKWRFIQNVQA